MNLADNYIFENSFIENIFLYDTSWLLYKGSQYAGLPLHKKWRFFFLQNIHPFCEGADL